MTKAYSIRIYGRVFNVGFRRYVHRYGLQCNVVGFVENDHADGCVHIEAEGEEKDLDRFTRLYNTELSFQRSNNSTIQQSTIQQQI